MQLDICEQAHRLLEELDARELIPIAGEHQHGAFDPRPVLNAQLLGMSRAVQRIAEQCSCRLAASPATDEMGETVVVVH